MKRAFVPVVAILLLLSACGGDDPNDPNGDGNGLPNGTFNATANGTAFGAVSALAMVRVNAIGGTSAFISATNAQGRGIAFSFNASAPGTYSFATSIGNYAQYGEGNGVWTGNAAQTGTSGSVTFSTFNTSRLVGTFNFTLQPNTAGATGPRTVSGSFDLAVEP
jgi:hypothetical protein